MMARDKSMTNVAGLMIIVMILHHLAFVSLVKVTDYVFIFFINSLLKIQDMAYDHYLFMEKGYLFFLINIIVLAIMLPLYAFIYKHYNYSDKAELRRT